MNTRLLSAALESTNVIISGYLTGLSCFFGYQYHKNQQLAEKMHQQNYQKIVSGEKITTYFVPFTMFPYQKKEKNYVWEKNNGNDFSVTKRK
jgi:hypothetical protein